MRRAGKSHPNTKKETGRGRVRIHIRFDRNFWRSRQFWTSWTGLTIAGTFAVVLLVGTGVFLHYWFSFERMMDMRLSGQVFGQSAEVLSAPAQIEVGQTLSPPQLVSYLDRAGYTEQADNFSPGWYQATGSFVEIHPSKSSYFEGANALHSGASGLHRLPWEVESHDAASVTLACSRCGGARPASR